MIESPEVSIIMPAYNSEKYISESILSVLKQTLTNWELIVADDCSSDKTEEIVQKFVSRDKRIKYYKLPVNSGRPAVPRNHAIEKSSGRYLAFLDSDDVWLTEKLEHQLHFMQENNLEFSFGPTGSNNNRQNTSLADLERKRNLLTDSPIACLTVMVRNRLEYRPIFDEDIFLKAAEDTYAWIQLHKKTSRIGYYDRCLSVYREENENSILKEYDSDPGRRMSKQCLFYSKLHLTNTISEWDACKCYFHVLYNYLSSHIREVLVKNVRKLFPRS